MKRRKAALKRKRGKGDWQPWPLNPNNRKLQALIATTALDPTRTWCSPLLTLEI